MTPQVPPRRPQRAFLRLGHPLQDHEPAMSYAARLAALNGVDLRKLLGDMRIDNLALGRGEEDAVESLAALRSLGREDRERLLRATPWHAVGDKVPTVNGNPLLPGSVLATSTRVCPHCIAEDLERFDGPWTARPWLRLDWVLAHVRACRRHGTILLDVRPDETLRAGHDFSHAIALQVLPVLDRLRNEAIPAIGTASARWFAIRRRGGMATRVSPSGMQASNRRGHHLRFRVSRRDVRIFGA